MSDCVRTELVTKFKCADCGQGLTINLAKSRVGANSAYVANSLIYINPCGNCKRKYSKPAELIKEALNSINEVNKEAK